MEEKRRNTMGTTEKNLAKLNTSTEYNTWLVKRDSLIFVKKELPLSQYDTMKTFYSLQEKTPSPFIVKIYNVFATETLCIIEEEWLSGTTIAEYLDKNLPFSSDETRQYGIEICQALRWIHKNRMVYRDLKPSNVIITNSGHAVLIDPGTIRMYKAIQSKDTVIIGTPGYAAPEQFGFHQTDQRADIYALGVLLNNMLTCAMLNEQLTTHKKFQKIIRRCLSIAAKNRYQSCLIVQRELERIVSEHSARDIRFFRCIPGFRSARLSHMIPASFFYLWAILMFLYFVITFVY